MSSNQTGPTGGGPTGETAIGDGAGEGALHLKANGNGSHRYPGWALEERSLSHLAAFIEAGAALNAYDSSSWLATLTVPSAVVVTSRDRVVPPWRQQSMAALLRDADRYVVDGGHDAAVARPDIFLPVLANACTRLALRQQVH
jgi:pimeloyl-ACP methyl ester carboxylesterase